MSIWYDETEDDRMRWLDSVEAFKVEVQDRGRLIVISLVGGIDDERSVDDGGRCE